MNNTRIYAFTGHFGSGKTEIAINFAFYLKKHYNKVAIVDLDIVNPYFRTKDAKQQLEQQGIRVVASAYANSNVDLPALPSEILSLFQDKECQIIFDVGGDDRGATALGRYNRYFFAEQYHMFFVINCKRPLTNNVDKTLEILHEIQTSSRLKVSSLINNTNLSYQTTIQDLVAGQEIIEKIAGEIAVPISYITGKKEILSQLPEGLEQKAFPIDLHLKFPWEQN